ncbi:uncharacterized protein LOC111360005 isoform X1 [Spodoptera litura]|uniref:Uncharacterized protein LOC111360005 isoform X1 n=1 Tax=Spodoptera litura TaxID=69820 RepID=A0A9J7IWT7_SPOLT|nr:uncharacterized protein LOC111360005 isoform X1 [Spodoptera litura]
MITLAIFVTLSLFSLDQVESAKQQVQLSDSYLPVAMQIISHITDQMAFEVKEDTTPRPTTKPTPRPTTKPTPRPTTRPTTSRPYVTYKPINSWWSGFTTKRTEMTTPFHRPGLYAPPSPPKPYSYSRFSWNPQQHRFVLLPVEHHAQYTILQPQETRTEEPLLSIHQDQIKPLMEPSPESAPYLPPHYDVKVSSRSDGYVIDDISEESLQYLSDDVREMIKMAKDPHDDKVVDVWDGVRQGNQPVTTKAKLSASNLRLLLLYDLLSRDAKRQRLSDYSGFSPDVMKALVASSSGGVREQLKMALAKMVERHDCGHEYANNRAREMVEELGKDESGISTDLRYLQPLIYSY